MMTRGPNWSGEAEKEQSFQRGTRHPRQLEWTSFQWDGQLGEAEVLCSSRSEILKSWQSVENAWSISLSS